MTATMITEAQLARVLHSIRSVAPRRTLWLGYLSLSDWRAHQDAVCGSYLGWAACLITSPEGRPVSVWVCSSLAVGADGRLLAPATPSQATLHAGVWLHLRRLDELAVSPIWSPDGLPIHIERLQQQRRPTQAALNGLAARRKGAAS